MSEFQQKIRILQITLTNCDQIYERFKYVFKFYTKVAARLKTIGTIGNTKTIGALKPSVEFTDGF